MCHDPDIIRNQVNVQQVSTSSKIFNFWSEIDTKFWRKNKTEDTRKTRYFVSCVGRMKIVAKDRSRLSETGDLTCLTKMKRCTSNSWIIERCGQVQQRRAMTD